MSRYAHNIHQVHIADGFSNDCDELIHRCLRLKTLDYKAFCTIWKDLNFGVIYQGRSSAAEIAELSEEAIFIAKSYMIKNTSHFEESVAGLFLVYGLLTLQPFCEFAWLRIVPDDVPYINRIEVVARRERRLDVLYILGEVLVRYSQYHASDRDRGMDTVLRKYLEGYTSIDKLGVRPRGVFYRQNEELDVIRDLGSITRQYVRAKNSLIGIDQRDSNLQYINENLATELNSSLRKLINGLIEDDAGDNEDDDDDDGDEPIPDHYDAVQAIKTKAMSAAVNPIKHLTRIEERKTTDTSPKKSELNAPTGNIKSSPKKSLSNAPRKRRPPTKQRKKIRKKTSQLIDFDEDIKSADLNIDEFQKSKIVNAEKNSIKIDEALKHETDTLSRAIQMNEEGRVFLIEVDNEIITDEGNKSECHNDNGEIKEDNTETPPISTNTRKVTRSYKRKFKETAKQSTEPDRKILRPRDYKRTKLKSKFKRMGMLPVANFKDHK